MFQIHRDNSVIHRKTMIQTSVAEILEEEKIIRMPKQHMIWYVGDPKKFQAKTDDWFNVRISVKGDVASLYIDEIFVDSISAIDIPAGRVGFRNDGAEKAIVRNIKVSLHPYR